MQVTTIKVQAKNKKFNIPATYYPTRHNLNNNYLDLFKALVDTEGDFNEKNILIDGADWPLQLIKNLLPVGI